MAGAGRTATVDDQTEFGQFRLVGVAAEISRERPFAAARYAWALPLARLYKVFLLGSLGCGGDMRVIAFIIDGTIVRDILDHLRRTHGATAYRTGQGPAALGPARCPDR